MKLHFNRDEGSSLVITVAVVATILTLLGSAISYTQSVSRLADRSRKTALAMEIADGHLEYLFTNWRNIYRKTWTSYTIGALDASLVGTNYFYTDLYKPGVGCTYNGAACPAPTPVPNMNPAATPVPIALPSSGNFTSAANYTINQYRIQAVDPMITLSTDGNERAWLEDQTQKGKGAKIPPGTSTPPSGWAEMNPASAPPAAYGPNTWQYSFYYLAAVDVTVPAMTGNVTAKVRRVFEKKFDNPWTYAMFFVDDLEFSPSSPFTITGPVHTNGNLYISTNYFTAMSSVAYAGQYVNDYSPNDTSSHGSTPTVPNFAAGLPPVQQAAFLPFGWDLNLSNADGSSNNDSYHELIEAPTIGQTDPLANIRMYNQADYRILIDSSNNITITDSAGTAILNSGTTKNTYLAITGAITTNQAIQDQRENTPVRLATLNIGTLTTAINNGTLTNASGSAPKIFYIKDTSTAGATISSKLGGSGTTVNTTERAIRLTNGAVLPNNGLTIASENPVYIQGNYNTGTGTVPSNAGTYTDPDASGYTRKPSSVMGDAITILSGGWVDTNSTAPISSRPATNTTINTALVGGITPSSGGNYSGGGENFIRYLEDWKANTFCYYGSMVELFVSKTGTGAWTGAGNTYKSPLTSKWYYDDATFSAGSPPGNLQIAAYLQQQRWYQVY